MLRTSIDDLLKNNHIKLRDTKYEISLQDIIEYFETTKLESNRYILKKIFKQQFDPKYKSSIYNLPEFRHEQHIVNLLNQYNIPYKYRRHTQTLSGLNDSLSR